MAKKININLFDKKSIDNAIKQLNDYSKDLDRKCDEFCTQLSQIGYTIAQMKGIGSSGRYGTHKMENYVTFKVQKDIQKGQTIAFLMGIEKTFVSSWTSKGMTYAAIIHPLEMMEFGTGARALPPGHAKQYFDIYSGKGSLAIAGHDNDIDWGKNNNWSAITPTMPMYSAYVAMFKDFDRVAKEVFRQ